MFILHTLNLYICIKYWNQAKPLQLKGSRNSSVEFKLDECWVLFTDILACNVEPDNDGYYGKFGSLASQIKNVFLPVSTEQWKLRKAAHYELWNINNDSRIDSACMVYENVNGS